MGKTSSSLPNLDVRTLPGSETVARRELSNGMVILARENFHSLSVVVSGFLPIGSLGEARDRAGLAHLTALALTRGTTDRSFKDIFEALESIGATLSVGASTHTTSFYAKGLAEDLDLLLTILSDVLRNPTFPPSQVDKLRAQRLTALAIREQDTGARAHLAFDELVYPDHPYAQPSDGYHDSVAEITPAGLRDLHEKTYGPDGLTLAVVGAIQKETVLDSIEKALGNWERRERTIQPETPPAKQPSGILRTDIALAGKSQSDIVLGSPGPSRLDERFLSAILGNSILGRFGLFGRIGDAVRKAAGLAYYSTSVVTGGLGPGPWQVISGVNPQNVDRAIDIIRDEIRRFVRTKVTDVELLDNQANFIGRLPLQFESNEGVAGGLTHIERYDLGLDYYQRYPDLVKDVTMDEILDTAKFFLDPDRLGIAVAGPDEGEI